MESPVRECLPVGDEIAIDIVDSPGGRTRVDCYFEIGCVRICFTLSGQESGQADPWRINGTAANPWFDRRCSGDCAPLRGEVRVEISAPSSKRCRIGAHGGHIGIAHSAEQCIGGGVTVERNDAYVMTHPV